MMVDYLIVGSGLTGAVIARVLADAGREVLVVDRRGHVGGNVHDHHHPSGIRVHTYGPHYFRTNSDEIWNFVNRFGTFYRYEARVRTLIDGCLENWPIAAGYIRRMVDEGWQPEFRETPGNFEEACLAMMPRLVYEKFVKGYTEKQWGAPARSLSASLARRFDVREEDEPRLMRHKNQGLPVHGYARLMRNMLDGIPVLLNWDYLMHRLDVTPRRLLIFTGPIDEFFGFDLGRLRWRSQRREHEYLTDVDQWQPCGQVNNPDPSNGPHIRTLEWKHMMPAEHAACIRGTLITRELPVNPQDANTYEYPFPDAQNGELYRAYRNRADRLDAVLLCGRLGEYRYIDMDQAIARALRLGQRIVETSRRRSA